MSRIPELVRRRGGIRDLMFATSVAFAVTMSLVPGAPAAPFSVPASGATVTATPYPAGQNRTYGFPVQYGDGHVCLSDGNDYRSLGITVWLAPYADGRGQTFLKEERQSPDYGTSPRPGPISGAGIGTFDPSQFAGLGLRPVNGRYRLYFTMSAVCSGSLVDKYRSQPQVVLNVKIDPKGKPPKVPPFISGPGAPATPPSGKPPAAKPKSILSEKSKKTLATAAERLRGYAENASALSKLCVLGALKKEAFKQSLKVAAKDLATSYIPVVGDIPTDPCSASMAAFIGIITLEAEGFDQLAKDPPDPRYRKLVKAKVRVPISYKGSGQTAAVASALNVLTANLTRASAYQAALLTSVERAQGASAAKQAGWAKKQTKAARGYAGKAADALSASPRAISRLASALKSAGYGSAAMTAAEAMAFQQETATSGLPKGLDASLTVLGASSTTRDQLRTGVQGAAPAELAAVGFPGILTRPDLLASIRSVAAALRKIARG